ncbi:maleylpyruvate isomerase N-terminal domain-containing protein [Pengzhenrongella sicca]|uniref:Maleylpyruvate isomerase family mycothiol-dependent enzyme n=1 Tax=Pengzhenrongella sicca TaxID=2819238 RepID=A0A8A4ZNN0_9MICO|nr:maleylpyruvate isomerase N-terminal domain-containing protein [Pengzhenrongella sicca]QTE31158.1 maleylpyruvate isomerase family mycothiol-dependent enzyme [Pengzhenrongella sicca]
MPETLEFPALLRLIDERSSAFRDAVEAAPSLDAQVPTCPDWTLLDLVHHLGTGRRSWAATIAAGPDATAKSPPAGAPATRERAALSAWLAASTREMVDALAGAGPDRGCWTWWSRSQSPRTCGAVARHQLHEIAVHTYDAQLTAGEPRPVPAEVALDGVEEFLFTCCATTAPWPHEPAVVDYRASEGRSWRVWLSADGARVARLPAPGSPSAAADRGLDAADADARGTASELLLHFYGRLPLDALALMGDRRVFERLIEWDPGA